MPKVTLSNTTKKLLNVNKWLKKCMIDYDMNQNDVAKLIGIGQPALSKKMKTNGFTLKEFIVLANYFHEKEIEKLIIY